MSADQWIEGVEYAAELLTLASVMLIWWPAFKVSRTLLAARNMTDLAKRTSAPTIARLAGNLAADAKDASAEFNATDYRMLLAGFACGALSSAIKLFYLIPVSHHH